MNKKVFALIATCMLWASADAQIFQGLGKKVKNKLQERIDSKTEKATGSLLDKLEGKSNPKGQAEKEGLGSTPTAQQALESYSKYDFLPGENILYLEDFQKQPIGELPANWNANGKGEVVEINKVSGKYLRLFPGTKYLTGNTAAFGDDFTIEFDLILHGTPPSGTRFYPELAIGLFSAQGKSTTDNKYLELYPDVNNITEILLKPNVDDRSSASLKTKGPANSTTFSTGEIYFPEYSQSFGKSAHYAIQVQKQRLRFWVNGHKVFDLPRAINAGPAINQLYFHSLKYWFYTEENFGLYLTNIKIAKGVSSPIESLRQKGSFSTSGILFDTNSDQLRPQSMGLLKEIGKYMAQNTEVKLQIVGHTDNEGEAASNLKLSTKRAAKVREVLVEEHSVDAVRIDISGKGESAPLNQNLNPHQKAQNRRVEFIRLSK
ncbi:MAG: OmpA family protein [Pedobacter sp.]|nr:MAG: OmpA family protein [Pedobacter sp.]